MKHLFLLFLTIPFMAFAMEKSQDHLSLQYMPKDIKMHIIDQIINESATLDQSIKSIRSLAVTNKDFNFIINDDVNFKQIVGSLLKKFGKDVDNNRAWMIACLDTKKAKEFFVKNSKSVKEVITVVIRSRGLKLLNRINSIIRNKDFVKEMIARSGLLDCILYTAIEERHEKMAKVLIEAGANPTVHMLELAIGQYDDNMVQLLLQNGVNPNLDHSKTPLVTAIYCYCAYRGTRGSPKTNKRFQIIKLLLQAGANPLKVGRDGSNAIDIINKYNLSEIKELMTNYYKSITDIYKRVRF